MKPKIKRYEQTLDVKPGKACTNQYAVEDNVKLIIYNKPTRCNSGSIVFINNYKYALHVSDALCVHHQEYYKL